MGTSEPVWKKKRPNPDWLYVYSRSIRGQSLGSTFLCILNRGWTWKKKDFFWNCDPSNIYIYKRRHINKKGYERHSIRKRNQMCRMEAGAW